ncbi:hypothetical protein VC34_22965 [Pseudomonas fluorescens]|uniref:Uncharacterized protein n=1 Tax=Pseudomonas fluorescens TaxID=294 RepID=A0A0F4T3E1_PSEFL|nr:hypothetical protein VC34_22965 [Pseudomonas fluorescens]
MTRRHSDAASFEVIGPVTLSGSSVDVAINDLANWTMVTQVGGYRPQFRPHRGVIDRPCGNNRCNPGELRTSATWALVNHTPMRPGAGEYQVLGQLSSG